MKSNKLPENAVVGYDCQQIHARIMNTHTDYGIFKERGAQAYSLMTWGYCHTKRTVTENPNTRFVFTGYVYDQTNKREAYEERF